MSYEGLIAETVYINGHNGDQIDAYLLDRWAPGPSRGRADPPHARLG